MPTRVHTDSHNQSDRPKRVRQPGESLRIGVGGPVGSATTAPVVALRGHAVPPDGRIAAAQTGGYPRTAIKIGEAATR